MYDGLPEFLAFLALVIGGACGAVLSIAVLLAIYLFASIPLHIALNAVFLISAACGVSAYLIYSRAIES